MPSTAEAATPTAMPPSRASDTRTFHRQIRAASATTAPAPNPSIAPVLASRWNRDHIVRHVGGGPCSSCSARLTD